MSEKLTDEQIKEKLAFCENQITVLLWFLADEKVENRKLQKLLKEYKQAKSNLGEFIMINYLESI